MRLLKTTPGEAAPVLDTVDISIPHPPDAGEADRPAETTPTGKAMPLRANFSWTLLGNIIYAGCQWAMLIVLARVGRSEMVGQFALGLAVTAPVLMCSNLNLRSMQATDARREYTFNDYLNLRLVTTVLALLIIGGIGFFSGYRGITLAVVLIVGVAKGIEAISDVFFGLLQQNEQMRPIAISMMIKGVLSLVALATTLFVTGSLVWAVTAMCAVWALVLALYDAPVGARLLAETVVPAKHPAADQSRPQAVAGHPQSLLARSSALVALRLVWLAAPMGIVMFLISLNSNIPRYFIERQWGLHELGIFAAITYLMVAGSTIAAALGQSATPRLSQLYASGETTAYKTLLGKLGGMVTVVGFGVILIAVLAGGPVLRLLYGSEYSNQGVLFSWLMVAAWLGYLGSMLNYGMTAARLFRVQAPIYLAALLTTMASCFWLVPGMGLIGGALAMGAGSVVQLAASVAVVALALKRQPQPTIG